MNGPRTSPRLALLSLLMIPATMVGACGDNIRNEYHYHYGQAGANDGGSSAVGGGGGGDDANTGGAGDPLYPDAPVADTAVADLELDVFGTIGNRYYFAVSDAQRKAMNDLRSAGGPMGAADLDDAWGPHYTPGNLGRANYVDHLFVTAAGEPPHVADYGQVQVKVVGSSTYQTWDELHIPNLNIDVDQFVKEQRLGGYEHLRFSNGQVGSIFRDRLANDIYRALGYPAPLVSYVWVESNVWGPEVAIPYLLVERYKKSFCTRYSEEFGGGCVNMWEFAGDFGGGGLGGPKGEPVPAPPPGRGGAELWDDADNCQLEKCDSARVLELEQKITESLGQPGFKDATRDYIDWPAYHQFQCLSWILATADDPIHASNNVVIVERADGLFQYLPYSVDISLGFSGATTIGLVGTNVLSQACREDDACWQDTLDACDALITDFAAIKPRELLLSTYKELEAAGMLRDGDDAQFDQIDQYLSRRLESLPTELSEYRNGKVCEPPWVDCGDDECQYGFCPVPCLPQDAPAPGGAGGTGGNAAIDVPIDCPVIAQYGIQ